MMFRILCIVLVFSALWIPPVLAAQEGENADWAVGLQGNLPLWGGLSVKYTGLDRIQFQVIEHYVQDGDEYSGMVGLQTPITIADYSWSKVYFTPGVGFRKTKERQFHYLSSGQEPNEPGMEVRRMVTETITGGALLFGVELFLDKLFGSDGSRYGLNIEFGQGVGQLSREATCEDLSGNAVDCEDLYQGSPWLQDDPDEREGDSTRASFVVGFGFHIYF